DQRFAPIGEDEAPRVLRFVFGTVEALQPQQARSQSPEAGLLQANGAPRRLDTRPDVQSLRHPEFAARSPAERVDVLMIVARAKSMKEHAALVGFAVANVGAAIAQLNSGGNRQTVGKNRRLAAAPFTGGVFEDKHFVVRRLAWL